VTIFKNGRIRGFIDLHRQHYFRSLNDSKLRVSRAGSSYWLLRSKYPIGNTLCLFDMVANLILTVETEVLLNRKGMRSIDTMK
jgi:hemolysin-activating ACP:hemolysin acyltransferase